MDWFVNGETGNVYFFKGISNLNDLDKDIAKYYNIDLKNTSIYENLGTDNMFGDKVEWGDLGNLLDYDHGVLNDDSEIFMENQGYVKSKKLTIYESRSDIKTIGVNDEQYFADNTFVNDANGIVTDSKITYAKPNVLNKMTVIRYNKADPESITKTESATYNLLIPYNKEYKYGSYPTYFESRIKGAINEIRDFFRPHKKR